jgi:hypothetical protein
MSAEEKTRVSGDAPRQGNSPVLPTVNPQAEKAAQQPGLNIHPTFYVIVWIACSSSVILFNKWLLDTLNFRMYRRCEPPELEKGEWLTQKDFDRLPRYSYYLSPSVRHGHDPADGQLYNPA